MDSATTAFIPSIKVDKRRREDMGDIKKLADSIAEHGLLHPIVIDQNMNLVVGHRRLEACRMLGWESIPCRMFYIRSEQQMRELELRENIDRKDFTQLELSKSMVAYVETVKERLTTEFRTEPSRNSVGGRPSRPDSIRTLAKETGIPKPTIQDAQAHVRAVEQYPKLEPLPKMEAIGIAREAKKRPEPERQSFISEEADKWYQKEAKKIDEDYKTTMTYHKAVYGALLLNVSEEGAEVWLEKDSMVREDRANAIDAIERAIHNLNHLKAIVSAMPMLRIVK